MHQQKRQPLVPLKIAHKRDLVLVYILYRQTFAPGFFCVKANWQPLSRTDVVNCALLLKICEADSPGFVIKLNRGYRRGYFLYNSQPFAAVALVCKINQLFKVAAAKPACHS